MENKKIFLFVLCILVLSYANCEDRTGSACENTNLHLKCDNGTVIQIKTANYGRTSTDVCHKRKKDNSLTSCYSDSSLQILKMRCNYLQECTVPAINDIFDDPCPEALKYLHASYTCEKELPIYKTVLSCHNLHVEIFCPKGLFIKILYANYGRRNGSICKSKNIRDTLCFGNHSVYEVKARCSRKDYCVVQAHDKILGDPCPGTRKYLEVKYTCLPDE